MPAVPKIVGLSVRTARSRCFGDQLLLDVEGPEPDPPVRVVAQRPPSGTQVPPWTEISVRVEQKRPHWRPRPVRWFVDRALQNVTYVIDGFLSGF